jgi:hypothetical protein
MVTTLPEPIAPPSPVHSVKTNEFPTTAIPSISDPEQLAAVVSAIPSSETSTSSSTRELRSNPEGKTICMVAVSVTDEASVKTNL